MNLLLVALTLAAPNGATKRDQQVIQAYILWNTRRWASDPDRPRIALITTPSGAITPLCEATLKKRLTKQPALRDTLVAGLKIRAKTKADYSAFKWSKPIYLTRENRQSRAFATAHRNRPFELEYRAELPAYSKDHKMAVLVTWEGPNAIHTVRSVSLLKRTNTGWKVSWSLPAYYL